MGALHACLLAVIREFEPGFQEPPFWKICPKSRVYTFVAIIAALLLLFVYFLVYAMQQIVKS
jgi:hypothetical protein